MTVDHFTTRLRSESSLAYNRAVDRFAVRNLQSAGGRAGEELAVAGRPDCRLTVTRCKRKLDEDQSAQEVKRNLLQRKLTL